MGHLDRFSVDNEESFSVLAEFVVDTVVRHARDAPNVPGGTLALLDDCVDSVLRDPTFRRTGCRAGELRGRLFSGPRVDPTEGWIADPQAV